MARLSPHAPYTRHFVEKEGIDPALIPNWRKQDNGKGTVQREGILTALEVVSLPAWLQQRYQGLSWDHRGY